MQKLFIENIKNYIEKGIISADSGLCSNLAILSIIRTPTRSRTDPLNGAHSQYLAHCCNWNALKHISTHCASHCTFLIQLCTCSSNVHLFPLSTFISFQGSTEFLNKISNKSPKTMDSTNTRSLRRHSTNLSYAEPSDFDFDGSSPDKEEQTQPYGESGSVQLNQSPGSASERMESNGDIKKRISHACDYCRRKKCKVYIL